MIYEIDGKYYILASHKFREVIIDKKDGEYDVKLVDKAEPIERTPNIKAQLVSVEQAYSARNLKNRRID